jgi:hypothetical protein
LPAGAAGAVGAAAGADEATVTRIGGLPGIGGGTGGGGAAGWGAGAGAAPDTPNSCRMSWFTMAELSSPQFGQMNCTGFVAMSGVTSNATFVPQLH